MKPSLAKYAALAGSLVAGVKAVAAEPGAACWPGADPAATANWQAKGCGMAIHVAPVSLPGREIGWSRVRETRLYDNLY